MTLGDVTEGAVRAAVAEFDVAGRDQFLEEAGFGRAKSYFRTSPVKRKATVPHLALLVPLAQPSRDTDTATTLDRACRLRHTHC